jgi:hypothetical protein
MEIIWLIGGVVIGWVVKVIVSDSEVRRLRRVNEALIMHRDSLEVCLENSDRMYRKTRESLLDLRRRYDKIYSNKYK